MTTRRTTSPAPLPFAPAVGTRSASPERTAAQTRLAPCALPAPARRPAPVVTGGPRSRRVLLGRSRAHGTDAVALAARYLEAAAAVRCVEVDDPALAHGDPRALGRLLAEGDALLVESLPRPAAGGPALPASLQVTARFVSAFGSAVARMRPLRPDLPLVAPIAPGAVAWERAAEVAFALAEAEGREEVWCAARETGWPLLAADRARRVRRVALSRLGVAGRRLSLADVRRRLLFPDGDRPALVLADAGELDRLVAAAAAGVGWANAVPSLHLGEGVALGEVASRVGTRRVAANGQLALAAARLASRVLRRLRAHEGARRLDAAVAAELLAVSRGPLEPWIELASEPAMRFAGAVLDRLARPLALAGRPS